MVKIFLLYVRNSKTFPLICTEHETALLLLLGTLLFWITGCVSLDRLPNVMSCKRDSNSQLSPLSHTEWASPWGAPRPKLPQSQCSGKCSCYCWTQWEMETISNLLMVFQVAANLLRGPDKYTKNRNGVKHGKRAMGEGPRGWWN